MRVTLKIKRFNPELDKKQHWEEYEVDVEPNDQLLDALNKVKWYDDGTLTYTFVESVKSSYPFWFIRFVGGALFLSGMFVMAWNVWKTIAGQKPYNAPVVAPATAHA